MRSQGGGSSESLRDLIGSLSRVCDRRMRALALADRLAAMGEERAALFLEGILRNVGRWEGQAMRSVRDALVDFLALREGLGPGLIERIRRVSEAMGCVQVLDLFNDGDAFRSAQEEDLPMTPPEFKGVTLGARKAMARQPTLKWLERLLQDQDPGVIRNLLLNPRVTEADVLKLASRTPVSARVLEEVARSQRWISRYRVKKALVLNPYTPLAISLPLLGFLMSQDLLFVSQRDGLSPALRSRARRLWEERRPLPGSEETASFFMADGDIM